MTLYDKIIRAFADFFCRFYKITLHGAENIPNGGTGMLLCANHMHNMDVVVIGAALRKKVFYMAKAELFKVPLLSSLIRALGAFPVRRGTGDIEVIKTAASLLADGKIVGVFPQGHRRPGISPAETEVQGGIGMILWRSQAAVLPVCIDTPDHKLKPFRKTDVYVGKPIPFSALGMESGHAADCRHTAETVFSVLCALPEENGKAGM